MKRNSCGLMMYNNSGDELMLFLVHPGGPYFETRDEGYWSIPKGLSEEGEDFLETAIREFKEETALDSNGEYIPLGSVEQWNNKTVHGWAFKTDLVNPIEIECNRFDLEWPKGSGKFINIPEVDRGSFFTVEEARKKLIKDQEPFIDRLLAILKKEQ